MTPESFDMATYLAAQELMDTYLGGPEVSSLIEANLITAMLRDIPNAAAANTTTPEAVEGCLYQLLADRQHKKGRE